MRMMKAKQKRQKKKGNIDDDKDEQFTSLLFVV